jgi:hypothetical protein
MAESSKETCIHDVRSRFDWRTCVAVEVQEMVVYNNNDKFGENTGRSQQNNQESNIYDEGESGKI